MSEAKREPFTDVELIDAIVDRFIREMRDMGMFESKEQPKYARSITRMELIITHERICKLRLGQLLVANMGDFFHDICGIHRHFDLDSGTLKDCFTPRYAA